MCLVAIRMGTRPQTSPSLLSQSRKHTRGKKVISNAISTSVAVPHSFSNFGFLSPPSIGNKSGAPPAMVRFLTLRWYYMMHTLNGCRRGRYSTVLDPAQQLHRLPSFQAPGHRRARCSQYLHHVETRNPPSLYHHRKTSQKMTSPGSTLYQEVNMATVSWYDGVPLQAGCIIGDR